MQFGFMSSVCPPLTLAELIDKAKEYDYKHLELPRRVGSWTRC